MAVDTFPEGGLLNSDVCVWLGSGGEEGGCLGGVKEDPPCRDEWALAILSGLGDHPQAPPPSPYPAFKPFSQVV